MVMLLWALQQAILGESGAWLEYIWWHVNLVFVGNLSSPVKSFVTPLLSDLTCFCQQSHWMINKWCFPWAWLCKTLIGCVFSHQLYNMRWALSRNFKEGSLLYGWTYEQFYVQGGVNLWRILQFSRCHKKLWSSWFKYCSVGGGKRQMQRSVGACTEWAQMCQRSEWCLLCSQHTETGSNSALCSFWVFLRNLHLCYSRNRQTISMGKELGRGNRETRLRRVLFSNAVF